MARLPAHRVAGLYLAQRVRFGMKFGLETMRALVHRREIPPAALRLLRDPAGRGAMRERIAALPRNRAVYEVVEIVGREAGLVTPSQQ